jgi:hypothetical protein
MTGSDVKVTVCSAGNCGGGSDQGGEQTERPEHKEMTATSKILSAVKSLERNITVRRPIALLGKADVAGEVTGTSNPQTVVVGVQASWEGLAEITSGRSRRQQGAGSNLQRLLERGISRRRGEPTGLAHESVGAMKEE